MLEFVKITIANDVVWAGVLDEYPFVTLDGAKLSQLCQMKGCGIPVDSISFGTRVFSVDQFLEFAKDNEPFKQAPSKAWRNMINEYIQIGEENTS